MAPMRAAVVLFLTGFAAGSHPETVTIDTSTVHARISDKFLSFCTDPSRLITAGWWDGELTTFWNSDVMKTYARMFTPSYHRFGGTKEDWAIYSFGGKTYDIRMTDPTEPTIAYDESIVDTFLEFSDAVGWEPIFGVNSFTSRNEDNTWNSKPLKALLQHVSGRQLAGWELGNEPDLYNKHHIPHVSVESRGGEFAAFRQILRKSGQSNSLVIGPDVTRNNATYMRLFLQVAGGSVNVATYHHYYGASAEKGGIGPEDFITPAVQDLFLMASTQMYDATSDWRVADSSRQLWIGETSSVWGGGSKDCVTFAAGFLWLDKLGLAANRGVSVVLRQVFAHADYSVVGRDNLPNPDFYSSLLFKKLVGTVVLSVDNVLQAGRVFRSYAFCSKSHSGGVVLMWLNTGGDSVELRHQIPGNQESYLLTSTAITSRDVMLNDRKLEVDPSTGELTTELTPRVTPDGQVLHLPPVSYGFVEFPSAGASACGASMLV